MSPEMIESTRSLLHGTSLGVLIIVVIFLVIGIVRPNLFRRIFKEFAERKYIVTSGIFICLLSGTMVLATEGTEKQYQSDTSNAPIPGIVDSIQAPETKAIDITVDEEQKTELIAFDHQKRGDPNLPAGQETVVQNGVEGLKTYTFTVTKEKGVETSRILKSEAITTQPVPKITAVGTQPPPQSKNTKRSPNDSCDIKNRQSSCVLKY